MQRFLQERWNLIIVLIILGAFWGGMQVGAGSIPAIEKVSLANKETPATIEEDFDPFWKAWNSINEKYPTANKITDQEKIYGAISGLVDSLNDPYSVFFGPEEAKSFEEEIAGNFSGVGMEVGMRDKTLTVIAPLKDTPAFRANIKPGDKILKIDETVTTNLSIEEAIKLIRGEKGTVVTLTISRDGNSEPIEVKITRDVINIPTLDTEFRPDGIFVIKLYSFSAISSDLFQRAMKSFLESGT
ncbi:MAG: PDZ domain-containing protein, partial [Candidatus Curtissbacteria bacterium]